MSSTAAQAAVAYSKRPNAASPPPPAPPESVNSTTTATTAEWKRTQEYTFTRWVNAHLAKAGKSIRSLRTDFSDGLALIALLEVLSGKKLPRHQTRPVFRSQKMDNVTIALRFLREREGVHVVNIGPADIVDSKLKLILGLIWHLILHYSISKPTRPAHISGLGDCTDSEGESDDINSNFSSTAATARQKLLAWLQNRMPGVPVTNFTTDWVDGRYLGYLVHTFDVTLCSDWYRWDPRNGRRNVRKAMDAAEQCLSVPQLIEPEDVASLENSIDEPCMMTYLAQFRNVKPKITVCPPRPPPTCAPPSPPPPTPTTPGICAVHTPAPTPVISTSSPSPCGCEHQPNASTGKSTTKCKAFGQGLKFGTAGVQNRFMVDTRPLAKTYAHTKAPSGSCGGGRADAVRLGLAIEGPSETQLTCTDNHDGFWTIDYKPDEPGDYTISVRLNDEHVEGSPFRVHVGSSAEGPVTNCDCKYCQSVTVPAGNGNKKGKTPKTPEHKGQAHDHGHGQPFSVSILGRNSPQFAVDEDRNNDDEANGHGHRTSQAVTFDREVNSHAQAHGGRTCGTKPAPGVTNTRTGVTHEVSVTTTIDLGSGKTRSKVTRRDKDNGMRAKHHEDRDRHVQEEAPEARKYPPIPAEWLPRKQTDTVDNDDRKYPPIPQEWIRPSNGNRQGVAYTSQSRQDDDDDDDSMDVYKSKGKSKPKVVVYDDDNEGCPCKDCKAKRNRRHRSKIVVWTDTDDGDREPGRNSNRDPSSRNVDRNVPYRETIVSSMIEIHHPQDSCNII